MARRVRGVLAVEGSQTGDGRIIAEGALEWADLPLPLAWLVDGDQHVEPTEAPQIGIIETIERAADGTIPFTGTIDDGQPDGAEAVRRMQEGTASLGNRFGVSIDPDDYEVEIVDRSGDTEEVVLVSAAGDGDPDDGEVVMEDSSDSMIERYTRLRIRGATLCSVAAFSEAWVELDDGAVEPTGREDESTGEPAGEEAIAAGGPVRSSVAVMVGESGAERFIPATAGSLFRTDRWATVPVTAGGSVPIAPPSEWFTDPGLSELTPLTVDEDGRVFGHAAAWGACHIGRPDTCLTAPRSGTGYAHFRTGALTCADGTKVSVGQITLDTGHAPLAASSRAAAAHYDNTGTAVADVVAGEDAHGIWVAGALRPDVDDLRLRRLRASALSGDWRNIGGNLELVGLLCVNVPGFGIPRTSAMVASGEGQRSLVAAGVVSGHADCGCGGTADEVAELRARVEFLEGLAAPLLASAAAEIEAEVSEIINPGPEGLSPIAPPPFRLPAVLRRS